MKSWRQTFLSIFLALSLVACEYSGDFEPSAKPELISVINNRSAYPADCQSSDNTVRNWQELNFGNVEEYKRYFAWKVLTKGTSDSTWAVLELDPTIVESALQIAVAENRIRQSDLPMLRLKAQKQLFKPSAKTYVLMHNDQNYLALTTPEPTFVSQRSNSGRLTGMSVNIGLGMKRGDIGMLMFEDKVCEEDTSYAIRLTIRDFDPGFFGPNRVRHDFMFGGDRNPLSIISSVYQPYVPQAAEQAPGQSYNIGNTNISLQNMLALGSFALDIILFLVKVL